MKNKHIVKGTSILFKCFRKVLETKGPVQGHANYTITCSFTHHKLDASQGLTGCYSFNHQRIYTRGMAMPHIRTGNNRGTSSFKEEASPLRLHHTLCKGNIGMYVREIETRKYFKQEVTVSTQKMYYVAYCILVHLGYIGLTKYCLIVLAVILSVVKGNVTSVLN